MSKIGQPSFLIEISVSLWQVDRFENCIYSLKWSLGVEQS